MRLAVSNIAWASGLDDAVAPVLVAGGVDGVEIAPTKVWPRPLDASRSEVSAYRDRWERHGLRVVALQALLFGHPELQVFRGDAERRATVAYLKGMIDLAEALGAGALVFGSPKNRQIGPLLKAEAEGIALAFFRELGDYAASRHTAFCVEANPADYGCDFLTTTSEAAALVGRVGSEGFGLHVDTGGMTLALENVDRVLCDPRVSWRHFHVSEPHLAPIGLGGADHRVFADSLLRRHYDGWISIEMKEPPASSPSSFDVLAQSVRTTRDAYVRPVPSFGDVF